MNEPTTSNAESAPAVAVQRRVRHLRITKNDIHGARRNCWDRCPIARSLRRNFPGNKVQVFDEHILLNGYQFPHTDDTHEFTEAWNEGPVRSTTLEMPDFGDTLKMPNDEASHARPVAHDCKPKP
jgi:hypothetical protein